MMKRIGTKLNFPESYRMYPHDFDEDRNVIYLNLSEVGLYVLALNEAWKVGGIPDDPKLVARAIRREAKDVKKAWPNVRKLFIENTDGMLVNPRQEKEREESVARSKKAGESVLYRQANAAPGFIYVAKRSDEVSKIGCSRNPSERIYSLRSQYRSFSLDLVWQGPVADMRDSEIALHRRFSSKKVEGEWFNLSDEDMDWIRGNVSKFPKTDTNVHLDIR